MRIETAGIPSQLLAEYATIPIAFEVTSVLSAQSRADQSFILAESRLDTPYIKDYDAFGDRPLDWAPIRHVTVGPVPGAGRRSEPWRRNSSSSLK